MILLFIHSIYKTGIVAISKKKIIHKTRFSFMFFIKCNQTSLKEKGIYGMIGKSKYVYTG